mgnify:CR=1 FL=1
MTIRTILFCFGFLQLVTALLWWLIFRYGYIRSTYKFMKHWWEHPTGTLTLKIKLKIACAFSMKINGVKLTTSHIIFIITSLILSIFSILLQSTASLEFIQWVWWIGLVESWLAMLISWWLSMKGLILCWTQTTSASLHIYFYD